MPTKTTVFKVVVCSPTGLEADREAVWRAGGETNRFLSNDGLSVDVKGWERDARPTLSVDAQSAVNQQLIAQADLAVVIVADRLGQPTARADSGTVEEARLIIKRKAAGEAVDLMLFFKRFPAKFTREYLEEVGRIVAFREEMSAAGALWREYDTPAELEELLRTHMPNAIRALAAADVTASSPPRASNEGSSASGSAELGVIDSEISLADAMSGYTSSFERITSATNTLSSEMEEVTEKANLVNKLAQRDPKLIREIVDAGSSAIERYNDVVESEIESVKLNSDRIIEATIALIGFSGDEVTSEVDDLIRLADNTRTLQQSAIRAAESGRAQQRTVAALPRMTSSLNKAKHRNVAVTSDLMESLEEFSSRLDEVIAAAETRADQLRT